MPRPVIHYNTDTEQRAALIDLIQWFKLSKTKLIFRALKQCETMHDLDWLNFLISFGGCEGFPVRMAIARVLGENVLKAWMASPSGSKVRIDSIK